MRPFLIITTTFFPAPHVGGIRSTQLARHLPEFGYKPVVLCRWYGVDAARSLLDEFVHPAADVIYLDRPPGTPGKSGSQPPAVSLRSATRRLRARLGRTVSKHAIPDAAIFLWRSWAPRIASIIERIRPVAFSTTSPPFSTHAVGLALRERLGIPWVASYEDPYLIDPRFGPLGIRALRGAAHRAFDRSVHERADIILHTIPMQDRWSRLAYPHLRSKNRLVTMGCPVALAEGRVEPAPAPNGVRSIRIVGVIGDQPASDLARAIALLRGRGIDAELRLVGSPPSNLDAIRAMLGERLVSTGRVRHDEALRQVAGADVLVSFLTRERSRAYLLSSKLFEYVGSGRPVLAVNPTASDRLFLRRIPHAAVLRNPNPEALASTLEDLLTNPSRRPSPGFVARFRAEHSWRAKARAVAGILDDLCPLSPDVGRLSVPVGA